MIGPLLDGLEAGGVRLVRGADAARVAAALREASDPRPESPLRLVACTWDVLPDVAAILSEALDALARAALALWPDWYGRSPSVACLAGEATAPLLQPDTSGFEFLPAGVFRPWLTAAADLCRAGRAPRLANFAQAIQATQLGLAIEPRRWHLLLGTTEAQPPVDRLLGLARAAEWLARLARARVLVLVPPALAACRELDSINFEAIDLPQPPPLLPVAVETPAEKPAVWIWPFHGRPHPNSPGEQLLAQRLERDAELGPLFAFNQPVRTVRAHTYTVDVLWAAGQVAVEIDGYYWHSAPEAFRHDRHRDYELSISGYTVLRLTHDEVVEDTSRAVEKIRDVVAFRRQQTFQPSGADT